MKMYEITNANTKGQIVIPKAIRKFLGITEDTLLEITAKGQGIYVHPVQGVITSTDTAQGFLKILEKTRGAWGKASKAEQQQEQKKKKLERNAARARRNAW